MKNTLFIILVSYSSSVMAGCLPPGQGFLEGKVKEVFHANLGETELKEWMMHPSNGPIRQELREIDRRHKFAPNRLMREELMATSRLKFDQAILNNERPSDMDNFPASGTHSKISSSEGALTLEMSGLSKEELDVLPKEVLTKLDPKIKINYSFPYDKFEYFLTYDGKELPILKALIKVQQDMEKACEQNQFDNKEYNRWYDKTHGGGSSNSAGGASKE
jgi:hypothetical protein